MKVLLAGKYVPTGARPIGGVQSWIGTVAAAMRRSGHEVTVWGPEFGALRGRFDVGVIANTAHTGSAMAHCERTVVVSHGIIPDERPPDGVPVAFTSEGVRAHWGGSGPVIRQPIDLEFWRDAGKPRAGILRYSYRAGLPWLERVARDMGMGYQHLRSVSHERARDAMQSAACVLATGRAALEAMACGAPVVIIDHRAAYQGPLMDVDIATAMERNYSGRGGVPPSPNGVRRAITRAMEEGSLRAHVERHHNADQIAADLLRL